MENYKPNSHKSKDAADKKQIEKVIQGTARVRKKSAAQKFTDVFISEDAANVKSYIFSDVLVPAIKKLVSDIVRDGIDMVLYGGTGNRKGSSNSGYRSDYISYNKYSDRRDDRRYSSDTRSKNIRTYEDIEFDNRGDAEAVLDQMGDLIERYGMVTVADLYDSIGLTGNYTDNKYGWLSIRDAKVVRSRDKYYLDLPRVSPID